MIDLKSNLIPDETILKRKKAAISLATLNIPAAKLSDYDELCREYPGLDGLRQCVLGSTLYAQVWFFLNFISIRNTRVISPATPESWEHLGQLNTILAKQVV